MKKNFVKKLNPLNSIFGRLFLWFWLTTIVMIICTALIIRYLAKGPELQTIPAGEQQYLEQIAAEIEKRAKNRPMARRRLDRLLRIVGNQSGENLVLMDKVSEQLFYDGPVIPFPFQQRFKNLNQADTSYGFMMGNRIFFGPVTISIDDREYALFKGRPARFPMLRHRSDLLFLVALLISGSLCLFLAWSFTRPIKELRDAAQQMARGNLQAGASQHINRKDEIGALSEDFRTMAVKVNELIEHQKRLLADISHELRSPLARLQLAIGIAQQNLENVSQQNEDQAIENTFENNPSNKIHSQVLSRIEKEAIQIDNMIARVLQLSRLESNTQDLVKQKVNFPSFIQSVLQDAEYEASSQGKALQQNLCQGTELMLEPMLISSAIENVVRNAIRYAKQNITIEANVEDDHLLIQIDDDGCGVPEAELDKLFAPFYRVSLARNRESGGTGLGLAIAIQAINAHNGKIQAMNNNKGGLSVEIKLPLRDS